MLLAFIAALLLPSAAQARDYGTFFPKDAKYQTDWRPFNDGRFAEISSFACILADGSTLNSAQQDAITDIAVIGGKIYGGQLEAGDFQGGGLGFDDPEDAGDNFDNIYDEQWYRKASQIGIGAILGGIGGAVSGGLAAGGGFALGYLGSGELMGNWGKPADAAEDHYNKNRKNKGDEFYNLGYATGKEGLQDYLSDVRRTMSKGEWAISQETYAKPGWTGFAPYAEGGPDSKKFYLDSGPDGGDRTISEEKQQVLGKMINTGAKTPIAAFRIGESGKGKNVLPAGCALEPLSSSANQSPSFDDMIDDFGGSVMDLLLYLPSVVINDFYKFISPLAFKFTFWTPHTERGDLFWTVSDSCDYTDSEDPGAFVTNNDSCKGDQALGYSKENLDVRKQDDGAGGMILQISSFVKWLLSGTYFLILFSAAAVFIVRGNAMRNFHLLRMLPWLLASIFLALLLPFILGAIISFANTLVGAFFGNDQNGAIARMGLMFTQSGILFGGDELFQRVINLIVGGFASYYLLVLALISLLRQIALIAIVIVAPIAAFSIITPSWRSFFFRWLKAFLVIAFLPVLFALIMRIGMSINPMVINPVSAYGTLAGVLGIILMVAVLFIMTKIARASKDFIVGQSAIATGAMAGAGSGISNTLGQKDGAVGAIGRAVGGSLQAQAANAENQSGSMIPKGRAASAGILTPGNVIGAWKSHREESPLDAAAEGRQEINAETYQRYLAEQSALGGREKMFEKHGFWVEKRGGKYYRNFNNPTRELDDLDPAPGGGSGSDPYEHERRENNRRHYEDLVDPGAGHAGAEPIMPEDPGWYEEALGGAGGGSHRPPPPPPPPRPTPSPGGGTKRPSSPSMPTPTTGTPAVPETGGPRPGSPPTGPAGAGANSGEVIGDVPGIGPVDGQGPVV